MRSNGRNPSRMDLASFFSNVHRVRPLPDSKHTDPHDLDVSTRPDLFGKRQTIDDVTVRPRLAALSSLNLDCSCLHPLPIAFWLSFADLTCSDTSIDMAVFTRPFLLMS